MNYACTVIHI